MRSKFLHVRAQSLYFLVFLIIITNPQLAMNQVSGEIKWLRVGSLQSYFSEQGSEVEGGDSDPLGGIYFSWPAEYGLRQSTMRARGMMLGCKNFYDVKTQKTYPYMVVNIGPKATDFSSDAIFNAIDFKLVGKFNHPLVIVNDENASETGMYDILDVIDESLNADRMLVVKNHTLLGITITKKVLAFTQQYNDNYFIYDYVLKNTGIFTHDGTVNMQTINDLYFFLTDRYSLSGESVTAYNEGWGIWSSIWGLNVVNDVMGTNPMAADFNFRANFAWYGPHSERPLEYAADWGCPNQLGDGTMAAAKYVGHVTLHADHSNLDFSDDPYQPRTTQWLLTETPVLNPAAGLYDEEIMTQRYYAMSAGHAVQTHAELVGDNFADIYAKSLDNLGGITSTQGFGPYTLAPGDSIHIVTAQGVAGLCREKNREVGWKWLQWYKATSSPELIMPDGSSTTDENAYKMAWVRTCQDSLMQTFYNALYNYHSGYNISQPPPPPDYFQINSGQNCIQLTWSDNARSWPHFDGYVIYRAETNVLNFKTVYQKIYECDNSIIVNSYDDTTAIPNRDYYYYIQSKDDGWLNNNEPGKPLFSNMFWTISNKPASLKSFAVEKSDLAVNRTFSLEQNFPNPFNPETCIRFNLAEKNHVTVKIFDLLGKEIEIIYSGICPAGEKIIQWHPRDISAGIYIYQLQTANRSVCKKLVYLK